MSTAILEVDDLSKRYCTRLGRSLRYGVADVARELTGLSPPERLRPHEFWALDGVSFRLRRGECLGLVGDNGAGKSTLLKLAAGLLKPDQGCVKVRGRTGALIELGAGIHPLLSGIENIRLAATIFGLSRAEIDARMERIIDFADLRDFVNAPVQSYSTGMKVRLGFAVAAHLDPDLLLVDEVLAVGDTAFRAKCYDAIARLLKSAAVVIVSHNMEHVTRLCDRALVLDSGRIAFEGEPIEAVARYLCTLRPATEVIGDEGISLRDVRVEPATITSGEGFRFYATVNSVEAHPGCLLKLNLSTTAGLLAAEFSSANNGIVIDLARGPSAFEVSISEVHLLPQTYHVSFLIIADRARHLIWGRHVAAIQVRGAGRGHQPYQLPGTVTRR